MRITCQASSCGAWGAWGAQGRKKKGESLREGVCKEARSAFLPAASCRVFRLRGEDGSGKIFLTRQIKGKVGETLEEKVYPVTIRFPKAEKVPAKPVTGKLSGYGKLQAATLLDVERNVVCPGSVKADGSFRFPPLLPGKYELYLRTDRFLLYGLAGTPVKPEELEEIRRVVPLADDFFPDRSDGYGESVLPMLYAGSAIPDSVRMKAVGAWAWGISRAIDCLETMPEIDTRRIMVIGHSRLGKTSLWAAATDPRIAVAVSNDSGSTGAALARGKQGETVEKINTSFPYWFTDNYKRYNGREEQMPFDQHMLLALAAPRPLYVASASRDDWADPRNEMRAAQLCGEVYALYGLQPLTWQEDELPAVNTPYTGGDVAYHLREGGHDIVLYDWERFMDFADKYFR